MDISEREINESLSRTESRLAGARKARRKQLQAFGLGLATLVVLGGALVLGVVSGGGNNLAPDVLLVRWPHGEDDRPLGEQHVKHGATVLFHGGQVLAVGLPEPGRWDAVWTTPDVRSTGDSFDWTPTGTTSRVTATIRAQLPGWKNSLASFWPARTVEIHAVESQSPQLAGGGAFLREIAAPEEGAWLHFRVAAKGRVRFDERAVKILGEAAAQLAPASHDAATTDTLVWQVTPAFGAGAMAENETGTNAELVAEIEPREALRLLDQAAPRETIKVIVAEGEPARVRVAFDGKGRRFVWERKSGAAQAEPQDWKSWLTQKD